MAIVIAAISGYLLMVFQSIDRMQTRIIERAYSARSRNPGYGAAHPAFDAEGLSLKELASVLTGLVRRVDSGEGAWEQGRHLPPVTDPAARAGALLVVTSAILRATAFTGGGEFETVEKAKAWLDQINEPLFSIARDLEAGQGVVDELIAAAEAQLPESIPVAVAELQHSSLLERFREWATRLVGELAEMRADIEGLQRYEKRRIPPRGSAVAIVVVIVATFFVAVALPLAHPTVSNVFYGWIPAGVYAAALLYVSFQVVHHYKGLQ